MIIVAILVAAAAVVLALAAAKPDSFRVERSVDIDAAPENVFAYLDDPRRQAEWSPWEKKDPAMKKTYSGAPKGVGAAYEWEGNRKVGAGRLEIVEVAAPAKVVMDLSFLRPMRARHVAQYEVAPRGDGACTVSWSIRGAMPLPSKVMSVFMDMDRMIGREFESGLADLKRLAEK
jgi:uncharacterized protein YndB with AHSA1/START domain